MDDAQEFDDIPFTRCGLRCALCGRDVPDDPCPPASCFWVGGQPQAQCLRVHHAELDEDGNFVQSDEIIRLLDEPDHDGLCRLEQEFFLRAIREDLDIKGQLDAALNSMRIVAAADESYRTERTIDL